MTRSFLLGVTSSGKRPAQIYSADISRYQYSYDDQSNGDVDDHAKAAPLDVVRVFGDLPYTLYVFTVVHHRLCR